MANYAFNHFNFNVFDLDRSVEFYKRALNLLISSRKEAKDGSFVLIFLSDASTDFRLELTWLKDRTEVYDLGEQEYHLAFVVDDFESAKKDHEAMGVICYDNQAMGIYFIEDPDGYWIEIVPKRK